MKHCFHIILCMAIVSASLTFLQAQVEQISIPRIELMANEPSPYLMRDWKEVATGYDSFVYDETKTGEHLPLVFFKPGVNYPERSSFGLDTYVGTFSNNSGEAINVLPSLVGATLMGIDKTDQFGRNWILMSQDFFNKANGQNIYLNNYSANSGGDWWYDMMPNVYFYQLYDLYGKIGDAENQFHSVADRMEESVRVLGGKATPWMRANMNYRAYDFLEKIPNPNGVHEPEAAGAYGWLLYHAYRETGELRYLQAAEWSIEFLIGLINNPSYELQLPYGAYIAAKMNAEIGTEYNVEKPVFWAFHRGPLRGWGTIVGNWNGFDVSGLVGEANDAGNDYAFQLNGVQQAAALIPMVRYDKRFARAIGKWTLNVANATRLMFPGFLADHLQDASAWSDVYDPEGVIGYEALREVWNGQSPVATGDALRSGWAATNLSLYSTSSIGYLAATIEKTDVEKILQIDLLKTDFFRDSAYPSYLYYNPFASSTSVTIDVGTSPVDIYDVISETFLATATGVTQIEIPADGVISIVLAPANGDITYDKNKMLINGVVVDYLQTTTPYNYPPRIQAFAAINTTVEKNDTITLYGKAIDQETKDLIYTFFLPNDTISGEEETIEWIVPNETGVYNIILTVEDENQQFDTSFMTIIVVDVINLAPEIISIASSSPYTIPGGAITLNANVVDGNDDPLSYAWSANGGTVNGIGNVITWNAPDEEGIYSVSLQVTDGQGGTDNASISLFVYDPDQHIDGNLIAWYPFSGNAQDISGNDLDGQVLGAKLTTDSLGNHNEAYFFDGVNDHINVDNEPVLNFSDGITVSLFVKPGVIGDKERFILSHGSWQNRWKVSITPENKIRWTVKFMSGQVRDLDSKTEVVTEQQYHVATTYNGRFMMLFINGRLESFVAINGQIQASPVDLEIGQILPDDASYNFSGVLDEIKIYDFALTPDSVAAQSGLDVTSVYEPVAATDAGIQIYPNPADDILIVDLSRLSIFLADHSGKITILDLQGREVLASVLNGISTTTLQVSSLLAGCYILRMDVGSKSVIAKFCKE